MVQGKIGVPFEKPVRIRPSNTRSESISSTSMVSSPSDPEQGLAGGVEARAVFTISAPVLVGNLLGGSEVSMDAKDSRSSKYSSPGGSNEDKRGVDCNPLRNFNLIGRTLCASLWEPTLRSG